MCHVRIEFFLHYSPERELPAATLQYLQQSSAKQKVDRGRPRSLVWSERLKLLVRYRLIWRVSFTSHFPGNVRDVRTRSSAASAAWWTFCSSGLSLRPLIFDDRHFYAMACTIVETETAPSEWREKGKAEVDGGKASTVQCEALS